MIQLQNLTPKVYYNESRDFQFIGRLYDVVLNSVKTNADMLYDLPISMNSTDEVLTLLALNFGFKPKHNYSLTQLKSLLSVFNYAMKNKGSIAAIEVACNSILRSEGIIQTISIYPDPEDMFNYLLFISTKLTDISLVQDFLDYVMPAGITVTIIRELFIDAGEQSTITVTKDDIKIWQGPESQFSIVPQIGTGLDSFPVGAMKGNIGNSTVIQKYNQSSDTEPRQIYPKQSEETNE